MAIVGTIGQHIAGASGVAAAYTNIDLKSKATAKGKIYTVYVDVVSGGGGAYSPAIKILRVNGANYDLVYTQTLVSPTAGENTVTLTTPVSVLVNDIIGYYCDNAGSVCVINAGTPDYFRISGNVTGTTATASWSDGGAYILGLHANIYSVSSGAFTFFLSEAWEARKKLWNNKKLILPENLGFSY